MRCSAVLSCVVQEILKSIQWTVGICMKRYTTSYLEWLKTLQVLNFYKMLFCQDTRQLKAFEIKRSSHKKSKQNLTNDRKMTPHSFLVETGSGIRGNKFKCMKCSKREVSKGKIRRLAGVCYQLARFCAKTVLLSSGLLYTILSVLQFSKNH